MYIQMFKREDIWYIKYISNGIKYMYKLHKYLAYYVS